MRRISVSGRQAGVTMVEVLVTIVIMSVGLLGYAGLVLKSQQSSVASYGRSQATLLAYDILERMRANRTAAVAGSYNVVFGGNLAMGVPGWDVTDWKANLAQSLPSGDGQITVDLQGNVTVTVQWQEKSDGSPQQFSTQSNI